MEIDQIRIIKSQISVCKYLRINKSEWNISLKPAFECIFDLNYKETKYRD